MCFPKRGFSFDFKKWRMNMATMLANYGGLGVGEWLSVWKASGLCGALKGKATGGDDVSDNV